MIGGFCQNPFAIAMKPAVFSLLLGLCTLHTQAFESYSKFRTSFVGFSECLETQDVSMPDIHDFIIDAKLETAERNPKLKCLEACMLEHVGLMENCVVGDDDLADFEMLKELHDAIVMCRGTVDASDRCECAYQLSKCIDEKLPKLKDDF